MTQFSDEQLCAYLDGEADSGLVSEIDAALEADPALEQRLAQLGGIDDLVKAAVPLPETEMPAGLRAAVDGIQRRLSGATVVPLRRPAAKSPQAWTRFIPTALAASVALVVGGLFGSTYLSGAGQRLDAGFARAGEPLHVALQSTPSGQAYRTADAELRPILTFRDSGGRACREFEVRSADAASVGVACAENGAWRVESLLAAAPAPAAEDGYRPASGVNDQALNAVLDRLDAGDALDAEAEGRLIGSGWR